MREPGAQPTCSKGGGGGGGGGVTLLLPVPQVYSNEISFSVCLYFDTEPLQLLLNTSLAKLQEFVEFPDLLPS